MNRKGTFSNVKILGLSAVALAFALGAGNAQAKVFDHDPVGPTSADKTVTASQNNARFQGNHAGKAWPKQFVT